MKPKILSLILLAFLSLNIWLDHLESPGIDFYIYWSVAKAQQLRPALLASPYLEPDAYAAVLNQHVDQTSDDLLRGANAYRRTLDMTNTPLLHTFFSILPSDYTKAINFFRFSQLWLFITSIVLIGFFRGFSFNFLALGLVLSAIFLPFHIDMRVGNLSSIQLFLMTISTLLVDRLDNSSLKKRFRGGLAAICLFIFIALLKPNLLLVMAALSLSFLARHGIPKPIALVPLSLLFGLFLIAMTNIFLGSAWVWVDWLRAISQSQDRLAYPIEAGNTSSVLLISHGLNIDIYTAMIAVAVFLCVSLGGVIVFSASQKGPIYTNIIGVFLSIFKDSGLAVSLALTATFALSPLVWTHYYNLLLLPALWMLTIDRDWNVLGWISVFSIVFSGGILIQFLSRILTLSIEFHSINFGLAWMLIWLGNLIWIMRISSDKPGERLVTVP